MTKIKLSEGFKVVSEGEHTFTVKSVEYKPDFNKVNLKMETESGEKHTEFFTIDNDKALFAFTMTAKTLMGDNTITDIEPDELVGKSMIATVVHNTSEKTGKVFASLTDKKSVGESDSTAVEEDEDDLLADL